MTVERIRIIDWIVGGISVAAIFGAGMAYQELRSIRNCLSERGCVKISVEAAERLQCLETHIKECRR